MTRRNRIILVLCVVVLAVLTLACVDPPEWPTRTPAEQRAVDLLETPRTARPAATVAVEVYRD